MNKEIRDIAKDSIIDALNLASKLESIIELLKVEDDPTPDPEPPGPDDFDYSFPAGTWKTYTFRGDGGGRDMWIQGFEWDSLAQEVTLPESIPGPNSGADIFAERCWIATLEGEFVAPLIYDHSDGIRTVWQITFFDPLHSPLPSCAIVAQGNDGNRLVWPIADLSVFNQGPSTQSGRYRKDADIKINLVALWLRGSAVPHPEPDDSQDIFDKPRLWIWREGSKAYGFGVNGAVVMATHGMAGNDAVNVRLICMNGDPVTNVDAMVARTRQAKQDGCKAVCIDLESHFIRRGREHAEEVYIAVTGILPLFWAPKAFNDHIKTHWGLNFTDSATWLGENSDGQIPWIYSKAEATDWLELYKLTRKAGNTKPYIPLGDFAPRGNHTPFLPKAVTDFRDAGLSIGVFMPDTNSYSQDILKTATWEKAVAVYG